MTDQATQDAPALPDHRPAVAGQVEPTVMRLWVWEDVLTDYTSGMVCALAPSEGDAWAALKQADHTAWWVLRGRPDDRDASAAPSETDTKAERPRCVTQTEAFVCWGGG